MMDVGTKVKVINPGSVFFGETGTVSVLDAGAYQIRFDRDMKFEAWQQTLYATITGHPEDNTGWFYRGELAILE